MRALVASALALARFRHHRTAEENAAFRWLALRYSIADLRSLVAEAA